MNLFLPEKTIYDSVRALDDRRLIKQILECKTILDVALDEAKKGYAKHPVVVYYKDYPRYIADYAVEACVAYAERFHQHHNLASWFWDKMVGLRLSIDSYPKPFYCEGLITDPNHIRTTENTVELFRKKLCKKWDNDKYAPKWTNREPPEWYKQQNQEYKEREYVKDYGRTMGQEQRIIKR